MTFESKSTSLLLPGGCCNAHDDYLSPMLWMKFLPFCWKSYLSFRRAWSQPRISLIPSGHKVTYVHCWIYLREFLYFLAEKPVFHPLLINAIWQIHRCGRASSLERVNYEYQVCCDLQLLGGLQFHYHLHQSEPQIV